MHIKCHTESDENGWTIQKVCVPYFQPIQCFFAHFIFITTKIDFRGGFILNFLANKRHVYFYSHFSVNCQWASWGSWQSCSKSCGGGTQKRYRTKSVVAQNGGNECSGSLEETMSCNTKVCPGTYKKYRNYTKQDYISFSFLS